MCCVGARRRDERSRYKCLSRDHKCHHLQQFLLRAAAARLLIRTLLLLPPAATLRHLWSACSQPHESLQATAKTLAKVKHGAAKSCQNCSKAPGHNEVVCRELLNSVCRPPQCSQATLSGAAVAIILGLAGKCEFARFLYFNIIMFVKNYKRVRYNTKLFDLYQ